MKVREEANLLSGEYFQRVTKPAARDWRQDMIGARSGQDGPLRRGKNYASLKTDLKGKVES